MLAYVTSVTSREKVVRRGVHFDFDKAKIRPEDMPVLDEAAETLRAHPDMRVEVNGYTDAIGSYAHNLRLFQASCRGGGEIRGEQVYCYRSADSAGLRQNQLCGNQQDCRRQSTES